MGRLAGKVAIITGAAQGMGESHARRFVAEGAKVMLTDIAAERGQRIADELGDSARFMRHDVTSEPDWHAVHDAACATFGPVTVLVNNAGVMCFESLQDTTLEIWNRVIAINQTGPFLGMKVVSPAMVKAGGGSIINVSSTAGLTGVPFTAYVASKFALRGMTKAAAIELAPFRVRVNSVHPGGVDTPMASSTPPTRTGLIKPNLQARRAQPEEITPLVLYLASDESSFSTGSEFVADGGATCY